GAARRNAGPRGRGSGHAGGECRAAYRYRRLPATPGQRAALFAAYRGRLPARPAARGALGRRPAPGGLAAVAHAAVACLRRAGPPAGAVRAQPAAAAVGRAWFL